MNENNSNSYPNSNQSGVEVNKLLECLVCASQINNDQILTLSCNHSFCKNCLVVNYWEYQLNNGIAIQCPQDSCSTELDYYIVKSMLSIEYFEKYEKIILESLITDPKETIINCPTPDCKSRWMIWKDADYSTCPLCKFEFCVKCRNKKHIKSCEWAQKQGGISREDEQFQQYLKTKNFQKCPYCNCIVEKQDGCNFIRCGNIVCKKNSNCFCYLCGDQLNESEHYSHYKNDNAYDDQCINYQKINIVQINENDQQKTTIQCLTDNCDNQKAVCENNFNKIIAFCDKCKIFTCLKCTRQINNELLEHFQYFEQHQKCQSNCIIF